MNTKKLEEKLELYKNVVKTCKENNIDYKSILVNPVCIVEIIEVLLEDPKPTNKDCCNNCVFNNGFLYIHADNCPCHTTKQVPSDWEVEFDREFYNLSMSIKNINGTTSDVYAGNKIKDFITTLLKQQKEDIINELRNN